MHFSTSVAVVGAAALLAQPISASRHLRHRSAATKQTVKTVGVKPEAEFSAAVSSSNTVSMKSKKNGNVRSAAYLKGLIPKSDTTYPTGNSSALISLFLGEEYATDMQFEGETFELIVDTGSSDTWLVETNFTCLDVSTGAVETEADCDFGPTFTPTEFVQIPDVNFNITYGDGEYLSGIFGYDEVTLAGITVNQTIALVNKAAWDGDDVTSGLVGLAYPAITSMYNGTDPTKDDEQIIYNPIFTTMYEEGLVDSYFSLAILRNEEGDGGYLTLGGVPPIDFVQNFTSTEILLTTIEYYPSAYDFYTIEIDDVILDGAAVASSGGSIQYIVDSGTTLNYFPTPVADAIAAAYSPAAKYSNLYGAYVVDCNATAPSLSISINGTAFEINPLDMILDAGTGILGNELCISGIDDGGDESDDVYILGDTFLKNVVAVFDVGNGYLRFAPHVDYPSDDTV